MWASWTFDPLQLAMLAVFVAAYARRATTLHARGRPVAAWRLASFSAGMAFYSSWRSFLRCTSSAKSFSSCTCSSMCCSETSHPSSCSWVSTARSFVPCSRCRAWRGSARSRTPSSRSACGPDAARLAPAGLYDAAVRHEGVHALEHMSFFAAGIALWLPVLETLPAPEWFGTGAKLGYVVSVRSVEMVLGNVLLWVAAAPLYAPMSAATGRSRRQPTRASPAR